MEPIGWTVSPSCEVYGLHYEACHPGWFKRKFCVRYIRQSPVRLKRFQESCDHEQLNCKKSLCLDVPTRWNSTYLMLSRAVEFENTFFFKLCFSWHIWIPLCHIRYSFSWYLCTGCMFDTIGCKWRYWLKLYGKEDERKIWYIGGDPTNMNTIFLFHVFWILFISLKVGYALM